MDGHGTSPGDALSEQIPENTKTVGGEVHSITCPGKDHKFELVVDRAGKSLTFHSNAGFMSGFSDTLWYGTDHFMECYHLEGMRTMVRYKPPTDNGYAGDIVELESRNDLPKSPALKVDVTSESTR